MKDPYKFCTWFGKTFDCIDCKNKFCHICHKKTEDGSNVCNRCYAKMDIQQLEE